MAAITLEPPPHAIELKKRSHSYEEALELAGFGPAQYVLTFLSGCCLMAAMNESIVISFVLSAGHCDLGLDARQVGMIGGVIFLGIMLSSFFWGYQADTRGRKTVLQCALFATTACSVASSFATGFTSMALLRFAAGMCVSASSAIAYTYLGEFCTGQRRGQMVAYAAMMISFGIVYGASISWWILSYDWRVQLTDSFVYRPWRLLFILCTIPGFLVGVAFYCLPESPKFLLSQNRSTEALQVLTKMYQLNNGREKYYEVYELTPEVGVSMTTKKGWDGVRQSLKDQTAPLLERPYLGYFAICCTNCIISFAIYGGFCLWFPQIMNQVLSDTSGKGTVACKVLQGNKSGQNQNDTQCSETIQQETFYYTIVLGFIGMFCSLVLSLVLRRVSSKPVMIFNMAIAGTAGILLQFVTNSYAVAVLFSVEIMFCAMGVTLINASAVSLFPTHVKGMATSLINMTGRFSTFLFSSVVGMLMAQSCHLTFYVLSGLLFLSSALTLLLP
ncbi:synaptic vesicle glycoprotein 2A [Culex quinquefasciatus]|uniref:Synaptic vesicle glycoprotein 2A n=4 Tax=Culex pipiens complex TaxID=518105 RepID=B0XE98_CULQU|nr:synaptic vesicle glycoprotein 2A [Culex quinquefasciatus]|eukprot:XP_001867970.1 synaptic vesicle glycoprotein 2A [Culex quinquefasciatus]